MAAYDVKRDRKALYAPRNTEWELVDVPEQRFIAIDGRGDPDSAEAYARAVEALYAVAYTAKFASKRGGDGDFVVAPLEGLWWSDDYEDFTVRAKQRWQWTMMISQPGWVDAGAVEEAKATAFAKRRLAAIEQVRYETLHEGRCAQVLHIGPYDDEAQVLAELHERYLAAGGLRPRGLHHEIYLSDPRKTEQARLRTVLRQPVEAA